MQATASLINQPWKQSGIASMTTVHVKKMVSMHSQRAVPKISVRLSLFAKTKRSKSGGVQFRRADAVCRLLFDDNTSV